MNAVREYQGSGESDEHIPSKVSACSGLVNCYGSRIVEAQREAKHGSKAASSVEHTGLVELGKVLINQKRLSVLSDDSSAHV